MKIRGHLYFVPTVTLVLLAAMCPRTCFAQLTSSKKISFNFKRIPLSVHGDLNVSLNDMPNGGRYIVGIKNVSDLKDVGMAAGQISLGAEGPMQLPVPESVADWTGVETGGNSVRVSGLGALQGTLLLFAKVPKGTKLSLRVNGQPIALIASSSDIIVQNGSVITQSNISLATLILKLTRPDLANNLPDVIEESPGVFVATPNATMAHVSSYTLPSPANADETVFVKLQIDQSGTVISAITAAYGSDPFAQGCQDVVWHWKFRPFSFNGKPVSVVTGVSFVSMQHVVQMGYTH